MNAPRNERPLRSAVLHLGERRLATRHGEFDLHLFRDLAQARIAMVLARGDIDGPEPLLARVHSSCLTSECLGGCDCDCAEQLDRALARIDEAGRGVLVYLMQEGRGAGLSAKARDRMLVQASGNRITTFDAYAEMGLPADLRRYDAVASIFAMLGVCGPLRLLTNNPEKVAAVARALESEKIEVEAALPVAGDDSPWNRDYLRAKRISGHALTRADRTPGARPPERVVAFEPVELAGDPARLVTASYFLPVALSGEVHWLRTSVLVDRASGRESIVLSRGAWRGPEAMARPDPSQAIALSLLDRLPVVSAPGREALAHALQALVATGAGCVGVAWDETAAPAESATRSGTPRSDAAC
ncbi:MAG: GTP cyclohydrolase II [Deltaproteobacteria bacterium]|nr:GTP cyclohydrolase II [Deltaproteobacteria bacterium]